MNTKTSAVSNEQLIEKLGDKQKEQLNKQQKELTQANVSALLEGAQLLVQFDKNSYVQGFKPAFHSTIGAHFRHILEHYQCFFSQIISGTIFYDDRQRNNRLECDHLFAQTCLNEAVLNLSKLDALSFERSYQLKCEQSSQSIPTSLERELLFLESHTLHHYAIIGAMSRSAGVIPEQDFGMAIATRGYEQRYDEGVVVLKENALCAQ